MPQKIFTDFRQKCVVGGTALRMDFVTPSLVFGALAAAAPVVLHLVMRQQPQHLEFPALRFVQLRENANRRRLKLRHLLLLLLRIAAICLLAAGPGPPEHQSERLDRR